MKRVWLAPSNTCFLGYSPAPGDARQIDEVEHTVRERIVAERGESLARDGGGGGGGGDVDLFAAVK